MAYETDNESDDEDDYDFIMENVSEYEDDFKVNSELDLAEELTEPQEHLQECSGAIYTVQSGLK